VIVNEPFNFQTVELDAVAPCQSINKDDSIAANGSVSPVFIHASGKASDPSNVGLSFTVTVTAFEVTDDEPPS
jgi:hypothetical protein